MEKEESRFGPKEGHFGLIEDYQVLATGIDKGLSQAGKRRSQATQGHISPILGAPLPPQNSFGGFPNTVHATFKLG